MNFDARTMISSGALAAASLFATAGHAAIVETFEAPGVTHTTSTFSGSFGTETFDAVPVQTGGFTSTFGGSTYQGTYSSSTQVNNADVYGGAGGSGHYAVVFTGNSYTMTLNKTATYFGYWLSAADAGNVVSFYNGTTMVGSLSQSMLVAALQGKPGYLGNPSAPYTGQNGGENYAFVNFYDMDPTGFNRVVFTETSASGNMAGYESDNHTVGIFATTSGTAVSVPEPTSCALVLVALAGIGVSRRKSKKA